MREIWDAGLCQYIVVESGYIYTVATIALPGNSQYEAGTVLDKAPHREFTNMREALAQVMDINESALSFQKDGASEAMYSSDPARTKERWGGFFAGAIINVEKVG